MRSSGATSSSGTPPRKTWITRFLAWIRRPSLRKTVVAAILILSLLPVVLVGAVSYYRTRAQMQSLVANQIYQITNFSANQLTEYAKSRQSALSALSADPQFQSAIQVSQDAQAPDADKSAAADTLKRRLIALVQATSGSEPMFSQVVLIDASGKVAASSDDQFALNTLGSGTISNRVIQPLLQTSASRPVYNPFPSEQTGLVLLSSQVVPVRSSPSAFTLLGFSPASTYQRALLQAAAFLPEARAFFVQSDGIILVAGKDNALEVQPAYESFTRAVDPVIKGVQTLQPITFVSYENQLVLAYVRTIPEQGLSLVLQVPTQEIFSQVPLLDGFTIYLLVTMFIILAMLAYVGASQVVNPLVHLSEVAQHFAQKDFTVRAGLDRKDEIGQLAGSIDSMAGELSGLYAGLENQVEQRTAQLRIASDVARIASSATRLDDTLAQTVNLVNERFHLYYTAIFLVDETHNFLTLRSSSATTVEDQPRVNRRLAKDSTSLPGLVASTNQAHQIADVLQLPIQKSEDTLPETRSRAAVPISIGSTVLGVLEAHSRQPHGIDSELLFVLQTVANQVAGAIQNMRLLETTQVDLDETNLLYQITRQVTAAADEKQAIDTIVESLPQLPHVSALLQLTGDQINIIALYDPRTRKLELGLNTVNIPAQKMAGPLAQGNPLYIPDFSTPSDFDPILTYFQRRACRSAVILPCMQAGKPSRILVIGFLEGQSASQASLQPLINLADVISASLEKFSVLRTLQRRLQELQVLATFSKTTSAETSLSQLFVVLHQLVVETMGSNLGFVIASYNSEREMIEFPFAYEDQQQLELDPMPLGNGLTSYIIQTRQPLLLTKDTEARAQELGARIIGKPAKSWLGVPLMVSGQLTGAIIVQDQHREERFSQDDLNLMMTLAPQIATAIRNTRLLDEMQRDLAGYRQDRLFLTTWLSNTPDQITIKDTNGTYIYASRSVGERLDTLAQNLVDKSDFDLMPQEIASSIYALDKEVIETGNARYGDIEQTGSTGAENWELVTRIPIRDAAGNVTGLMSIRRNVTDMKQAEAFARNQAEAVRTTAEIARDAAGILDIDELLNKAVNLVRDRFNFYHASVFLLDPLGEYAVLRESTGEAGRQMKENHHRLAVGSKSIVGQSTARAEPIIVPDVTRDSTHFPNPLLPDTRAEMAIPLIFGGKVIGALDVQSTQPNIFTNDDREILTILADQLAATIHNAELFTAAQGMLVKHKLLHQINLAATTASNLQESLERVASGLLVAQVADRICIYLATASDEILLAASAGFENRQAPDLKLVLGRGIIGATAQERRPIRVDNVLNDPRYLPVSDLTRSELALPINFGEELIGVLNLESDESAEFTENDQDIMAALANNLGAVIANWRLVDRIQSQVDRQKLLFEATSKIRRSVDISTILQTSIEEIGHTMGVRSAQITLLAPQAAAPDPAEPRPQRRNGNHAHADNSTGKVE